MQVERSNYLSPIEKELNFSLWTKKNGIKQFLFDLDDTICSTRRIFVEHKQEALDYLLSSYPSLNPEQFRDEYIRTGNEAFEKLGVNSNQFNFISDCLCDKFNLSEETRQTIKGIYKNIYDTPLTFLDGAQETLQFLKKIEMPLGIVTHGNRHWTYKKYQWLNLERFLNWEDVYVIDENTHKTSESWLDAIQYFRLQPQDCVVVGDSPRADINPASQIGVRHCFLVESQIPWSIHQQPVSPEVRTIKNISEIISIGSTTL